MIQKILVLFLVVGAVIFLARKYRGNKSTDKKSGCGKGCGCH